MSCWAECWLVWLHERPDRRRCAAHAAAMAAAVGSADQYRSGLLSGLGAAQSRALGARNTGKPRCAPKRCIDSSAMRTGSAMPCLLIGTIGLNRNHMAEAERALREAEELVTDATALRKQAALAATQGECYGSSRRRLSARSRRFVGKASCIAAQAHVLGEYLALGNVGSAQLEAGELDRGDRVAAQGGRRPASNQRALRAGISPQHAVDCARVARRCRRCSCARARSVRSTPSARRDEWSGVGRRAASRPARSMLRRAVLLAGYALSEPKTNSSAGLSAGASAGAATSARSRVGRAFCGDSRKPGCARANN